MPPDVCKPYDSSWFAEIIAFLLNAVPEETGKVGTVCYHGKNAEGEDCIFIKIRRSVGFQGIDLRIAEDELRKSYDGQYMGGGGHAGAVSFRVHPHDEDQFLANFHRVIDFLNKNMSETPTP